MVNVPGVHLLPASGEFVYDTLPYLGAQREAAGLGSYLPLNTFFAPGGTKTDYSYGLDQLQAEHPETKTVSLVCAWFFNTEDASTCNIYPSTIFLVGGIKQGTDPATAAPDHWRVSSLTEQDYPGIIPLPFVPGPGYRYVYGGTPSDQSIVRCIQDLKSRGFRVIFYPFLLGTGAGFPWRGRVTYAPDLSSAATAAVNTFLGTAQPSDFTPDPSNLTVSYSGNKFDWTYRRMILHYAMLCTVAGGVDLFVDRLGVARPGDDPRSGLDQSRDDRRLGLCGLGLSVCRRLKAARCRRALDLRRPRLYERPDRAQEPHRLLGRLVELDGLAAPGRERPMAASRHALRPMRIIDYRLLRQLPAAERLDDRRRRPRHPELAGARLYGHLAAALDRTERTRPHRSADDLFDRLSQREHRGRPIFRLVLQRRRRRNSTAFGFDPNGSGLMVYAAEGDRLAQARNPYYRRPGDPCATKQLRWWWNNPHYAVYATRAARWAPQGPQTEWSPAVEIDRPSSNTASPRSTRRPISRTSSSTRNRSRALTPFWSIWDSAAGGIYLPRRDDTIAALALEAVYEYWNVDGNNATSRRRPRHAQLDVLLRLELGRAAVSDLPDRESDLGRYRQLAARRLGERPARHPAAARADAAAVARGLSELPDALGSRLVGACAGRSSRRSSPIMSRAAPRGGLSAPAPITTSN